MKNILLTITFAAGLIAVTYSIADMANDTEISALERTILKNERKVERLGDRLRKAKTALIAATAQANTHAVSLAAFEVTGNPFNSAKKATTSATQIAELEQERADLLAALDESQQRMLKSREKKPSVRVHYFRPDKEYYGWGVHAIGDAVTTRTSWSDPIDFRYIDDFGSYAKVTLHPDHKQTPLEILLHNGPTLDCDPSPNVEYTESSKKLLLVDAAEHKDVYLVSGISRVFTNKAAALAAKAKMSL